MNAVGQCAIIMGIGGVLLALAGRQVLLAARSWSWRQVQGTVVNSYVMSSSSSGTIRGSGGQATYLVIVYKYTVEGQGYESQRWGFDGRRPKYGSRSPTSGKLIWHESELLAAYPKGAPITVYYDPGEPASATITRSVGLITYLVFVLGMALVLVGGVQLANVARL